MNREKPLIGIMGNLIAIENGAFIGNERVYVTDGYVDSIIRAGGSPIIIPPVSDKTSLRVIVEQVDGILLSGGYDVDPILFGEEPKEKLGFVHKTVDESTIEVIKIADEMGKPIFGICKGIQILNVAYGGSLFQDISYMHENPLKHEQNAPSYNGTHLVRIEKNSKLYKIVGEEILVNSYHHQAVKKVAKGFNVVGKSSDGVIEAIEKQGDRFILAVQWHPEMMSESNKTMQELFNSFVTACMN